MRLIQKLLVLTSFSLIALCASASPSNPVEGVDYQRLPQAQPTEAGKKTCGSDCVQTHPGRLS